MNNDCCNNCKCAASKPADIQCHSKSCGCHSQPKDIVAFCHECGTKFTEWVSDSKECPECEGEICFTDKPPTNESSDWREEFNNLWDGVMKRHGLGYGSSQVWLISFIEKIVARVKEEEYENMASAIEGYKNSLRANIRQMKKEDNHEKLFSHRNGHCKCNFNSALDSLINLINEEK